MSASAADRRFAGTHYEYQAAQTQAKATAKLLRAGRERFAELKKILEFARTDAVDAGMKVSEQGRVTYDYDRLTSQQRADLQADAKALQSVKENEASWAEYIDACVKSFDEADKDLKASLETVVTDVVSGSANDMTFGSGFNGQAKGDMVAAAPPSDDDDISLDLSSLMMDPKTETLSMWSARAQGDIVTRLSGNAEWGRLYSRYVSGTVSIAAFARATAVTVPGAFALIQAYRNPGVPLNAPGTLTARLINGSTNVSRATNVLNSLSPPRDRPSADPMPWPRSTART
ncbi:hypothetical protein [Streptomyces sp. NPDC056061]|uniref:hypothetical protein n=1 Tax=Streptomyces sp. NPDC056061 TaxID=3345700 RepID=UPI0035D611EC